MLPHQREQPTSGGGGPKILTLSLTLNGFLILGLLYRLAALAIEANPNASFVGVERVWHGGNPQDMRSGSCWCGSADNYCLCTPNIGIEVIVVSGKNKDNLWLVSWGADQLATIGGYVDVDERFDDAVKRELKTELGVELKAPPKLFGFYTDPRRNNRRRTVSAVYVVHVDLEGDANNIRAGGQTKVTSISMDEIEQHSYFGSHRQILIDYRKYVRREPLQTSAGGFDTDLGRSTCGDYQLDTSSFKLHN